MKKIFTLLVILAAATTSYAQRTEFHYSNTQARMVDVTANAHVKPLTVEMKVKEGYNNKVPFVLQLSKTEVEVAMKGNLEDIRALAVYEFAKKEGADLILAATFKVSTNSLGGYDVEVRGFPANFINWRTVTTADYDWIHKERLVEASDSRKTENVRK